MVTAVQSSGQCSSCHTPLIVMMKRAMRSVRERRKKKSQAPFAGNRKANEHNKLTGIDHGLDGKGVPRLHDSNSLVFCECEVNGWGEIIFYMR